MNDKSAQTSQHHPPPGRDEEDCAAVESLNFAAWEQPELFVGEMRASFKSLR
jgi:hypothetical protein